MTLYDLLIMLIGFAQGLIAWQYYDTIFEEKQTTIKPIVGILLLSGVSVILYQNATFIINGLVFYGLNILTCILFYKCSYKNMLFHVSIITIVMSTTELFVIFLFQSFDVIYSSSDYEVVPLIVTATVSRLLYCCVLIYIGRKIARKTFEYSSNYNTILVLCVTPFTSVMVCIIFLYISVDATLTSTLQHVIAVTVIVLLVANILLFTVYQKLQDLNQMNLYLKLQVQKENDDVRYYQLLGEQNQKQRILMHDISKHLQTLRGLCEKENHQVVSRYIDEIQASEALKQQVEFCDNTTMNVILNRFTKLFQEKGIVFHVDVDSSSLKALSVVDITAIFSNLLENAYEATECGGEAFVELICSCSAEQKLATFSLVNSCQNAVVVKNEEHVVSTKADHERHGVGLKSVQNIVKKHRGWMRLYYSNQDDTFHAVVTIPLT